MADLSPEAWTVSANEVITLTITGSPEKEENHHSFKPTFTYPIFGDSETIFGYSKDLKIGLKFDCLTLKTVLEIQYSSKIPNVEIDDVELKLLEFLPKDTVVITNGQTQETAAQEPESESEPENIPGEIIHSYTHRQEQYTIYKTTLSNTRAIKLHERLQIFVLFYIEAGSYIDDTDHSWDIYLVYKTTSGKPQIVGYCTAYNYFSYRGHELHDSTTEFNYRKKISQFIILPPYQGQHHGQQLYNAMFSHWVIDDQIMEICVEDPNENFDDLRDRCDLMYLFTKQPQFIDELCNIELPYLQNWFNTKQAELKIEKRQLQRLIEMILLKLYQIKKITTTKKNIRLTIKKRLYWKNKDSLLELDLNSQMDKLQTAFEGLEQDYNRILEPIDNLSLKRNAAAAP